MGNKPKKRKNATDVLEIIAKAVSSVLSPSTETSNTKDYTPLPGVTDLRAKYTSEWLTTASLEELETERLKVQSIFLNMDTDMPSYWDVHTLITEFDEAINNYTLK